MCVEEGLTLRDTCACLPLRGWAGGETKRNETKPNKTARRSRADGGGDEARRPRAAQPVRACVCAFAPLSLSLSFDWIDRSIDGVGGRLNESLKSPMPSFLPSFLPVRRWRLTVPPSHKHTHTQGGDGGGVPGADAGGVRGLLRAGGEHRGRRGPALPPPGAGAGERAREGARRRGWREEGGGRVRPCISSRIDYNHMRRLGPWC